VYYKFLSKFHVEPDSWEALFEFTNYTETEGKVEKEISDYTKELKNNG
jgi:hypothetical protein